MAFDINLAKKFGPMVPGDSTQWAGFATRAATSVGLHHSGFLLMHRYSASPIEIASSLWRNRALIIASTQREVLGRYRGSAFGVLWSLFNPILMLAVYTFVFSVAFKARWSAGSESRTEFALVLFVGLIVFNMFSETIHRAPSLILSNQNYVKKVVFPLEILPIVALLAALFHGMVSLAVWLFAYFIFLGPPHATALYLPLIILPLMLLVAGLGWALAAIGVFLRDVSQFIGAILMMLMFLTPVFYPLTVLPDTFQQWLHLNPLAPVIEQSREVLYWGKPPDFYRLGVNAFWSGLIAWLGFAVFQKTRRGFADVL